MAYNSIEEMLRMAEHPEGIPNEEFRVVGKRVKKIDAEKMVRGKPVYTDDFTLPGMLYARMLTSPHAHARIKEIDTSRAEALPGVHAVLTYKDVPRIPFYNAGQSHPSPSPTDFVSLDNKVRYFGDRVAVVAAETEEIAEEALHLIQVDYEVLPAVFDPEEAMKPGAPIIHDEPDSTGIHDPSRNVVARIEAESGDVGKGFAEADLVLETEVREPFQKHVSMEPHSVIGYWDEDGRLVLRSSTQVPFHVRRLVAWATGLSEKQIKVVKPRLGGGFGGKQDPVLDDLVAHLVIKTGRPVRMVLDRKEEFESTRARHAYIVRLKMGLKKDGTITAVSLHAVGDTGAYGAHGLTVLSNVGSKTLGLLRTKNMRFIGEVAYTNHPTAGAFRGYGAPEGYFALGTLIDEAAQKLGVDVLELYRKNWVREGDVFALAKPLGEGREGYENPVESVALEQCASTGADIIGWEKRNDPEWHEVPGKPWLRRGMGVAVVAHGSAIPGLDMGGAYIKINDDGSFNLLYGGVDIGTGADTVMAQIAAEILGCYPEDVIVFSGDTDFVPFDKGAYASSTTFISGGAVKKAAAKVADQIREVASEMLEVPAEQIHLEDRKASAPDGRSVTLREIAMRSLHMVDQHQIMATASHMSYRCPQPFAAQFAQVVVDTETGEVRVEKFVTVADIGQVINLNGAEGQIEGGVAQGLGYALSEEMVFSPKGHLMNPHVNQYRIFTSVDMPEMVTMFIPTVEPSGPLGAKSAAELPLDGVAPAVANAIANATGVRLREIPMTPERVLKALKEQRNP